MGGSKELNIIAIYGFPIEHSLSPAMHNAGFSELALNFKYIPVKVAPPDLAEAMNALKALNFKGANITVPHKEKVMEYLDEVTENAFLIGAVNTVHNVGGRLIGYNTDCTGFIKAIKEAGITYIKNESVVVLGAGGASKAACVGLLRENVKKLVIANRTARKAELLLDNFRSAFPNAQISVCALEGNALSREFRDCGLLVNTTSAGLAGESINLPLESLKKGALVYDMIYNPPKTKLLQQAQELGFKTENGLTMLLYQGAEGFEIWTKKKAPVTVMKKALYEAVSIANS